MTKRIFRDLSLDKIAAVDRPCQEPALMAIMKRAPADEPRSISKIAKALCTDLAKLGYDGAPEKAESFQDLIDRQDFNQELWDCFYNATDALRQSILSILDDDSVTDKSSEISESLKEFADHIQEKIPGQIGKSLSEEFVRAIAGTAGATLNKGDSMSDSVKKALGLPATATEAEVLKAIEAKGAGRVEKMSDKHSAFMNHKDAKMPKGGKDAFQDMTGSERDKHMSDNPIEEDSDDKVEKSLKSGDAFKTPEGAVMFKRDFGTDAGYNFAKSANDRLITQAAEIAKRNEEEAVVKFAKRADDLGFGSDFGPTLRKAYQGDGAAQVELEKRITALQKQVDEGALFDGFGKGGAKAGSAEQELMAKVEEIKKTDAKLTDAQAYAKAYKDPANADIRKRMKQEASA